MPRSVRKGQGPGSSKLADDTEGSFSFQIPTSIRGDYLLADDGESFFQGAGDILATPAPRFDLDQPLTLSQMTPGPSGGVRLNSQQLPRSSAGPSELTEDNPLALRRSPRKKKQPGPKKPKPNGITRTIRAAANAPVSPPAKQQTEDIRAQCSVSAEGPGGGTDGFPSNSPKLIPRPTRRGKDAPELQLKTSRLSRPRPSKQTVADAIEVTQLALPSLGRVKKEVTGHAEGLSRGSTESHGPAFSRGVDAPRLISNNKDLDNECTMREGTPILTQPTQSHTERPSRMAVDSPPFTSAVSALTVSQLSPQKPDRPSAPVDASEGVPLIISASKRPADEANEDVRPQKRAKTCASKTQSTERAVTSASANGSSAASSNRRLAGSRSRPTATAGRPGAELSRASGTRVPTRSTKRRSLGTSKSHEAADPPAERGKTRPAPRLSLKARLQMKSVSGASDSRLLPAQGSDRSILNRRSVMRATVPHEFKFQVDTRLEARKGQSDKVDHQADGSKLKVNHAIPNFKALHAAHEAELALRKENIHPTVPVPLRFETDVRMKERHKFEEQVREKELQRHLELEQKRKERQEREEVEIRELRRKAIPKAHEVPEWYRDAPKKVKSEGGV